MEKYLCGAFMAHGMRFGKNDIAFNFRKLKKVCRKCFCDLKQEN